MRLPQDRENPASLAGASFLLRLRLGVLGSRLCLVRLTLNDERYRAHHGLILAIGDVISHGLLHEVPSSLVPETNVVLDRPRALRGERHGISDRGDRNQWARMLREAGLAGPGFVELPASNAAPFTEPNADWWRSRRARLHDTAATEAANRNGSCFDKESSNLGCGFVG
jgi:hypothetical protein